MLTARRLCASCFLILCSVIAVLAQAQSSTVGPKANQTSTTVTASATAERVRFTAPSNVVRMQLQVISETGQILFEVSSKGNVLDWSLQDSSGQRLQGSYLTLVTVKSLSGRVSERTGTVSVAEQQVELKPVEATGLMAVQQQAVGPVEENGALTILKLDEGQAVTVVANNGSDGQIIRDRGALSFRLGDFFSGNDKEQMRLTEEGNLGIGTAKPKTKLDVAGMIRAREGYAFSDGSKLDVNEKGALTLTNSNGTIAPNVSGTGSQNRLPKWTDNSGTLGDSVAIDTGTGLQLTAAPSISVDTNLLYLNSMNGTTGMLAGSTPSYGAANGPFFAMRGNTFTTIANQRGLFTIGAGNVASPAGDDGSVKFNTGNDLLRMVIRPSGNVGIGVSNPGSLLDVAGDISTSTQYNIGGNRILGSPGVNLFAGVGAGNSMTGGTNNSFFGTAAGGSTNSGSYDSFFGFFAGAFNNSGSDNSFFGNGSGDKNTGGSDNSFFGVVSGNSNIGGANNSFFGAGSGRSNTTGNDNTTIGHNSDVGSGSLSFATAIGAGSVVSSSNTIALGRADGSDIVDVPGKLQIDTMGTSGSSALCLNGSNRVSLCMASSLRYKTQVHTFLGGLEIVRRLRPISFTWKEDGARDLGLGAEEVQKVEPLLTFRNKRGQIEGVKYNQLSAVFVNAFKEQQQQIQELQREVVSLKNRIAKHHRRVASHRWS